MGSVSRSVHKGSQSDIEAGCRRRSIHRHIAGSRISGCRGDFVGATRSANCLDHFGAVW